MTYLIQDFKTYKTLAKYPFYFASKSCSKGPTYPLYVVVGFQNPRFHFENGQLYKVDIDHIYDDPQLLGPIEPPLQGCNLPRVQGPYCPNHSDFIEYFYPRNYKDLHVPHHDLEDDLIEDFFNMREFGYISHPYAECNNYTLPIS